MIPPNIPALSIRQPWAYAILNLGKDIENRDWATEFRGRVLLHASKTVKKEKGGADIERRAFYDLMRARRIRHDNVSADTLCWMVDDQYERGLMLYGGIVGEAEIVDCVEHAASPWFVGRYGFVLRNVKPLPFTPCAGRLGFFYPALKTEGHNG